MAQLAAVTGATGFLGRRLVDHLLERGVQVRALARRRWEGPAIDVVAGELADADALARLAEGAQVLVHVAGLVKARTRREFMEVNGLGAGRAAQAAARAGARLILVSSLVAREPRLSAYAASKHAGEAAAREALGEGLTIVRPPAIYGPGDLATLDLFRAATASPFLPIPHRPAARLALAHVDDVCAVICDLAQAPHGPGPFAIGGARPAGYSWPEIVAALSRAAGRRPRTVAVPAWALLAAGAAAQGVSRVGGVASMFTLGKARELLHPDWTVDARDEAPVERRPEISLEEGFARTLAWYRERGWIG